MKGRYRFQQQKTTGERKTFRSPTLHSHATLLFVAIRRAAKSRSANFLRPPSHSLVCCLTFGRFSVRPSPDVDRARQVAKRPHVPDFSKGYLPRCRIFSGTVSLCGHPVPVLHSYLRPPRRTCHHVAHHLGNAKFCVPLRPNPCDPCQGRTKTCPRSHKWNEKSQKANGS